MVELRVVFIYHHPLLRPLELCRWTQAQDYYSYLSSRIRGMRSLYLHLFDKRGLVRTTHVCVNAAVNLKAQCAAFSTIY